MPERNLDFDTIIDRNNTNSLKYDFALELGMPEHVLPLWVADMDFRVSSYIQDAISHQVQHGIFGYSDTKEEYFRAVAGWMERHHDWKVKKEWLVRTPGIVFALAMAVRAFTKEGDGVLICQPVYYPFSEVILDNNRKLVNSELVQDVNGRYGVDFEDFEEKIVRENVKLFILCSPHNPVGRVWTKEELLRMGEICKKHNVIIVSDEIHADFVYSGKHQVFTALKEEYMEFSIVCTSPSKTFNIAGLQISNIFIPNPTLREAFQKQIRAAGFSELNIMGLAACEAAYNHGEEWYNAMLTYVEANIDYIKEYLEKNLAQVKMQKPEGTYLVWLDFRELSLSSKELEELIVHKAGLWLDGGEMFGAAGAGFQRVNTACPRKILTRALNQLKEALNS